MEEILLPLFSLFLGLVLIYLLWQRPAWSIYASLGLLAVGELARVTLPVIGTEVLILDIFVLGYGLLWLFQRWIHKQDIQLGKIFLPFLVFVIIAFFSLVVAGRNFSAGEMLESSFYLVRFIGYFLLYIIALNEKITGKNLLYTLATVSIVLALAGFWQLVYYPDFTAFSAEGLGWDPHIGRLLSTWFDPNYVAGFFAFAIIFFTNLLFDKERLGKKKIVYLAIIFLLTIALFLTFSRSGYVMLLVGLILTGLRSPKILLGLIVLSLVLILAIPRANERVQDLYGSTFAFVTNSPDYSLDVTAQLRVESWYVGNEIFKTSPIIGVGYNTLRFVKQNRADLMDEDLHSASGIDSSLLTILATTGILGFLMYSWMLLTMLQTSWRVFKKNADTLTKNMGLGFLLAMLALLVHAFFVNSLLLPFFLVVQFVTMGVIEKSAGK